MEEALLRKYPPAFPPDDNVVEDKPAIVRDVRGRHLAWYLPGAMSEGPQACLLGKQNVNFININFGQNRVMFALERLRPYFAESPPVSGKSWRNDETYFWDSHNAEFPPGIVNLAPLWTPAGHEVCELLFFGLQLLMSM